MKKGIYLCALCALWVLVGCAAPAVGLPTATATEAAIPVTASPYPSAAQPAAGVVPSPLPSASLPGAAVATAPLSPSPSVTTLITFFTADPLETDPGASVTLAWQVDAAAEQVTLCRMMPAGQYGECWDTPPTGSQEVVIPAEWRNFITFSLGVISAGVNEMAAVTITLGCPDTWFMESPPNACPLSPAQHGGGSAQFFEEGLMIWRADQRFICVLFADGASPAYHIITDQWVEGMPESDPLIIPPEGLFQPVRGFGLVWRGEAGYAGIRERLGWALGEEFGFQTAFQCDSAPKYNDCYLLGPDGVIVLKPNASAWAMWE